MELPGVNFNLNCCFFRLNDGGVFYSGCKLHGTSIVLDDEDEMDELDEETAAQAAFVLVNLFFDYSCFKTYSCKSCFCTGKFIF